MQSLSTLTVAAPPIGSCLTASDEVSLVVFASLYHLCSFRCTLLTYSLSLGFPCAVELISTVCVNQMAYQVVLYQNLFNQSNGYRGLTQQKQVCGRLCGVTSLADGKCTAACMVKLGYSPSCALCIGQQSFCVARTCLSVCMVPKMFLLNFLSTLSAVPHNPCYFCFVG